MHTVFFFYYNYRAAGDSACNLEISWTKSVKGDGYKHMHTDNNY
jgi:hypothetical protein